MGGKKKCISIFGFHGAIQLLADTFAVDCNMDSKNVLPYEMFCMLN